MIWVSFNIVSIQFQNLITTNPQPASIDAVELALFEQKILLMHQPCIPVENDY